MKGIQEQIDNTSATTSSIVTLKDFKDMMRKLSLMGSVKSRDKQGKFIKGARYFPPREQVYYVGIDTYNMFNKTT